eukprot:2027937-Pyramimonas_sp.AAC.1
MQPPVRGELWRRGRREHGDNGFEPPKVHVPPAATENMLLEVHYFSREFEYEVWDFCDSWTDGGEQGDPLPTRCVKDFMFDCLTFGRLICKM